ncbi:MAG: hypothetical protein AVDCRST_MAG49-880 [uncultured Thermomicrobiales bacterium]|uniref:Uncharacterized protein n=1 Tax=uncultured Thermomicrobiales bacterium TaxID=1645740 RepID=A0A6J4U8B1_9BACT|nr:MAG: hypothetical protein AVDCRST_MAG49-880 [uncultured Thermomicrobiales bacterium]
MSDGELVEQLRAKMAELAQVVAALADQVERLVEESDVRAGRAEALTGGPSREPSRTVVQRIKGWAENVRDAYGRSSAPARSTASGRRR